MQTYKIEFASGQKYYRRANDIHHLANIVRTDMGIDEAWHEDFSCWGNDGYHYHVAWMSPLENGDTPFEITRGGEVVDKGIVY